jgi:hypothetical protein
VKLSIPIKGESKDILVPHLSFEIFVQCQKKFEMSNFLGMLKFKYYDLQLVQLIVLCTVKLNTTIKGKSKTNKDIFTFHFLVSKFLKMQKKVLDVMIF